MDGWQFINLGTAELRKTNLLQESLWGERKAKRIPNTIIFSENSPTISLGIRSETEQLRHIKVPLQELGKLAVPLVKTNRGGSITIHGPGILGCYIIADVSKLAFPRPFIKCLEEWIKDLLKKYSLAASSLPDELRLDKKDKSKYEGLWVYPVRSQTPRASRDPTKSDQTSNGVSINDSENPASSPRKIASIGIRFKSQVSQFGVNLNVAPEEWLLNLIYPCGIKEYTLTSLKKEGVERKSTEIISHLCETAPKFLTI